MAPIIRLVSLLLMPAGVFACIQGTSSLPRLGPTIEDLGSHPEPIKFGAPVAELAPAAIKESGVVSEQQAQKIYKRIVADYEQLPAGTATPEETNDYAASLMFLRRPAKAVAALVRLERDHPGEYATAANLGTAYELTGDVPNALTWIREGVKRNPASHQGTEWLHVAILETKLKLQGDAKWLQNATVLAGAASHSPAETRRAIEYQLNERLRFIKPKDQVVCDLFYQAALLVSADDPARREYYFKESLRFGDLRKQAIKAQLTRTDIGG